jgi:plastocyanin
MKTHKLLIATAIMLYVATGCGGGASTPSASAPGVVNAAPAPAQPAGTPAASGSGATISGKVAFAGTAPKPTPIKMTADPICVKNHVGAAQTETVVVNSNGTLKNVFVYVKSGLTGKTYPVPTEPVVFDQKGCQYLPHVFGIRAGQPLKILNSDGTLHNVHTLPKINTSFNAAMPKHVKELTKKFDKPEQMVKFQCEVHNWMNAWAGVMDNPFFAVTGDDGTYSIKGLPPGTYEIVAWHEKYGMQTQKVTVAGTETKQAEFKFTAS